MSIKDLFSPDDGAQRLDATDLKQAFETVESADNAAQITVGHERYIPTINYGRPTNFAKYGSAYLYYKSSIERIINYYPYDGSDAEINEFLNDSLEIDLYILNRLYPRTTGHILLSADGWGSRSTVTTGAYAWYGLPAEEEYITFFGGPNTASANNLVEMLPDPQSKKFQYSNIWDEDIYQTAGLPSTYGSGSRESNLKSDFDNGVTVEFWLKKASWDISSATQIEVVYDQWNTSSAGQTDYGRITIELTGTKGSDGTGTTPFMITAQSGTAGFYKEKIGVSLTTASLTSWGHYAVRIYNSGSNLKTDLFVNGRWNDSKVKSSVTLGEISSGSMVGRIGALLAPVNPTTPYAAAGYGKLSASMDEFRFWKVKRTRAEIGRYWFDQVRGGVNTDIANTDLGMYYKFNEGITQTASVDSIVLDYGGRLCNGTWTGYDSYSRSLYSAIVAASGTTGVTREFRDPIIRGNHPSIVNLKEQLLTTGSVYDSTNSTSIMGHMPSWLLEEVQDYSEENELAILCHMLGTYFDTVYQQIQALPSFKAPQYTKSNKKPIPFARHLPQSLGLVTPPIFVDASVMEQFLDRNEKMFFERKLFDTKNLIYQNLYNNAATIFKNKGTERAISNVFRCFNVDDRLLRLNLYSHNNTYVLENNFRQTLVNKTTIDHARTYNMTGVVYQRKDTTNPQSQGYLWGSTTGTVEYKYGTTIEADVILPAFIEQYRRNRSLNVRSGSLFGMHTVDTGSAANLAGTVTTFVEEGTDYANFQVYSVKEDDYSKNAYFVLSSSNPWPFPTLTSSVFVDAYDNTRWNLSVRLRPSKYPLTAIVSGAGGDDGGTYTYDVIFSGHNHHLATAVNSFKVSASITQEQGQKFLRSPKRLYTGARKTNITGALRKRSDAQIGGLKYWAKYLEDNTLGFHATDIDNMGLSGSYRNLSPLDPNTPRIEALNANSLALNWTFSNVTSSDSTGNFVTTDFSSGSSFLREGYNYGWLGRFGWQHSGYGTAFPTSSAAVKDRKPVNAYVFTDPEMAVSSDMVKILNDDDKVFGIVETVPSFYYTLEKSMYNTISEEMLDFFAGAIDFNNLIGEPVNRYRSRYKGIEKLREAFFRRVTQINRVEKYVAYYKWFDSAITQIIAQLVPASSDLNPEMLNTVESHVLERNKYETKYPTMEFVQPDLDAAIEGITAATYDWYRGSSNPPASPRNTQQFDKRFYYKVRDEADSLEISVDTTIDAQRQIVRNQYFHPYLSSTLPTQFTPAGTAYTTYRRYGRRNFQKLYKLDAHVTATLHGGVNYPLDKNIQFTQDALRPAGPINTDGGLYIPQNVLVAFATDVEKDQRFVLTGGNPLQTLQHRVGKVNHGRNWEDGVGYMNVESTMAFPFNIVSSSCKTGFNKAVIEGFMSGITLTNLHSDTYGIDMETPMQGPFTNWAVGGRQARHVPLNRGSDHQGNRPEAWKILLGTCIASGKTGALGMVPPDYPYPENNEGGMRPYPLTGAEKAVYYRDFIAKSPVNIKNLQIGTGSHNTLGNYQYNYEVVNSVGAFSNPRSFIENQPVLPTIVTSQPRLSGADIFTNMLALNSNHIYITGNAALNELSHSYPPIDYLITDNSGANANQTIITSIFGAPGSRETSARGFRDVRSGEFSVYNVLGYKNLSVLIPGQPPSGAVAPQYGIRVYDIHGDAFGLNAHAARHSAQFGRDSLLVTNPGASYDQAPSMFKVNRNAKVDLEIGATTTQSVNRYDNFNVTHQIPRMDKQYSWVTGAMYFGPNPSDLSKTIRFYGYAPTFGPYQGLYSQSVDEDPLYSGWVPYFNYVTASGVSDDFVKVDPTTRINFRQPTLPLNIWTIDPVTGTTEFQNLIGFNYTTTEAVSDLGVGSAYINSAGGNMTLMPGITTTSINADYNYLNLLLTRRGATYGWNWKATRQANNPVIIQQVRNNRISYQVNSKPRPDQQVDRLAPVSMRGRPTILNAHDMTLNQNVTIKATSNNNEIFMNDTRFNNFLGYEAVSRITPAEQLAQIFRDNNYSFNWTHYTENVFPALWIEFSGTILTKPTYNNGYWRKLRLNRSVDGAETRNSWGFLVDQSIHPMDEPQNFLYRTAIPAISGTTHAYLNTASCDFPGPTATNGATRIQVAGPAGLSMNPPQTNFTYDITHFIMGAWVKLSSSAGANENQTVFSWGQETVPYQFFIDSTTAGNKLSIAMTWYNQAGAPYTTTSASFTWKTSDSIPKGKWTHVAVAFSGGADLSVAGNEPTFYIDGVSSSMGTRPAGTRNYLKVPSAGPTPRRAFIGGTQLSPASNGICGGIDEVFIFATASTDEPVNYGIVSQSYNNACPKNLYDVTGTQAGTLHSNSLLGSWWRFEAPTDAIAAANSSTAYGLNTNSIKDWGTYACHGCPETDGGSATWGLSLSTDVGTSGSHCAGDTRGSEAKTLRFTGSAGELQNTYTSYFNGCSSSAEILTASVPAALFARKHYYETPNSVVHRNDNECEATGSYTGSQIGWFLDGRLTIDGGTNFQGGGEALFQVDSTAGSYKDGSWQVTASMPWADSYSDFNYELRLLAKDYAIIPEYIHSNHVSEYLETGINNIERFDTFEFPDTQVDSSGTLFYTTYSNSEFMKGFVNWKETTGMSMRQIRVSASVACRLRMDRGAYPASRIIQLSNEFSKSYGKGMMSVSGALVRPITTVPVPKFATAGTFRDSPALYRVFTQPFIAPGILCNTIKNQIAVSYPLVTDGRKIKVVANSASLSDSGGTFTWKNQGQYALTAFSGAYAAASSSATNVVYNGSGSYWDKILDWEAILKPEKYLEGTTFLNHESHPSCSYRAFTGSWVSNIAAPTAYTLMAENFFGEIHKFFLEGSTPSKLKSAPIDKLSGLTAGDSYGMRIKLRRSHNGNRTYQYETGAPWARSANYGWGMGPWSLNGAKSVELTNDTGVQGQFYVPMSGTEYSVPQDPIFNGAFKHDFVTYSRLASACGPPIGGGAPYNYGLPSSEVGRAGYGYGFHDWGIFDSGMGSNPAYTAPDADGEAWIDCVWHYTGGVATLSDVLSQMLTVHQRFDAGMPQTGSGVIGYLLSPNNPLSAGVTPLIPDWSADNFRTTTSGALRSAFKENFPIYGGFRLNDNAMQLSHSVNIRGLIETPLMQVDAFGRTEMSRNEAKAYRWIIEPKAEMPATNHSDLASNLNPISVDDGNFTLPTHFSHSAPMGTWHQYGAPHGPGVDSQVGRFLEVGPIPSQYLKNAWMVKNVASAYNNNSLTNAESVHTDMKSLSELVGFEGSYGTSSARLGELASSRTIKEAIVLVPYVIEAGVIGVTLGPSGLASDALGNFHVYETKKFIDIPAARYDAAIAESTAAAESLDAAGESIRLLIQQMQRYLLPPQFDFVNNKEIDPFVMYMLEFEHTFDLDDLAHIWQNIAPEDGDNIEFKSTSFAHKLLDTELLEESNLIENENLRWMVFKVKEKSQARYYDIRTPQSYESNSDMNVVRQLPATKLSSSPLKIGQENESTYTVGYNWPYDYISFVEMAKIDVEVLYSNSEFHNEPASKHDTLRIKTGEDNEELVIAKVHTGQDIPVSAAAAYNAPNSNTTSRTSKAKVKKVSRKSSPKKKQTLGTIQNKMRNNKSTTKKSRTRRNGKGKGGKY